ncbi:hypothetical protein CANCADRAFT_30200 [Tortispora caseinolytica NRRL Y-17796]|uniref:Uncharacterized protein n=1 Tax=Tortispora caseinolytica NRRL Y-17796 TaxID=767744 RepID=A0A1E4TJM0_9ASCO|nr:hypothetical protein CANCADRAFT_30200 [Tortispora caseinolytica NRRL Y-17796]
MWRPVSRRKTLTHLYRFKSSKADWLEDIEASLSDSESVEKRQVLQTAQDIIRRFDFKIPESKPNIDPSEKFRYVRPERPRKVKPKILQIEPDKDKLNESPDHLLSQAGKRESVSDILKDFEVSGEKSLTELFESPEFTSKAIVDVLSKKNEVLRRKQATLISRGNAFKSLNFRYEFLLRRLSHHQQLDNMKKILVGPVGYHGVSSVFRRMVGLLRQATLQRALQVVSTVYKPYKAREMEHLNQEIAKIGHLAQKALIHPNASSINAMNVFLKTLEHCRSLVDEKKAMLAASNRKLTPNDVLTIVSRATIAEDIKKVPKALTFKVETSMVPLYVSALLLKENFDESVLDSEHLKEYRVDYTTQKKKELQFLNLHKLNYSKEN